MHHGGLPAEQFPGKVIEANGPGTSELQLVALPTFLQVHVDRTVLSVQAQPGRIGGIRSEKEDPIVQTIVPFEWSGG